MPVAFGWRVAITITIATTIRWLICIIATTVIMTTTTAVVGLCSNIKSDYMFYGIYTVFLLDIKGSLFLLKKIFK